MHEIGPDSPISQTDPIVDRHDHIVDQGKMNGGSVALPTTLSTDAPRCSAQTRAGRPCRGYARPGKTTCYEHSTDIDPDVRRASKARGGTNTAIGRRGVQETAEAILATLAETTTPEQVGQAMSRVFAGVLTGAIPPRIGSTLAQVAAVALRAFSQDMTERLQRLERAIEQHPELKQAWQRRRR